MKMLGLEIKLIQIAYFAGSKWRAKNIWVFFMSFLYMFSVRFLYVWFIEVN